MKPRALLIAIAGAVLIAGCAAPPPSRIDSVYTGLQELLPRFDPAVLAGRTIVLDPGHGGFFAGTSGTEGLKEAEVNLGVALYLGGLLEEAGATVEFTRSADRDFLIPGDSTLAGDLARRIALVDSLQPDLFISIHHNAQALRDPSANAIETYYAFGDPASRDLAIAVHRHLMRNLGIRRGEIRQGNYYVLRNVSVPAILGEASYLTNPQVEEKLRLSAKQKLEAEAYYLGVLDYFRRGTPRVRLVAPRETTLAAVPVLRFEARDIGGIGIDPDAIFLTVNGEPVSSIPQSDGRVIVYPFPWDAPNGTYTISMQLRNLMGNSSPRSTRTISLDFPPELCRFEYSPDPPPPGWGVLRVRATLLDRRGVRVADGSSAAISVSGEGGTIHVVPSEVVSETGRIEFYIEPEGDPDSCTIQVQCRGQTFQETIHRASSGQALRPMHSVVVLDGGSRAAVAGVSAFHGDSIIAAGSRDGLLFIPGDLDPARILLRAPGYRPVERATATDSLFLTPWFGSILHGKRFVLDPQGGGIETAGIGRLGLPASHVNLQVARYCATFLRLAGAEVMLTRSSEETPTPQDIVAMTNRFGADRYIEIRHHHGNGGGEAGGVRTFCFPGSRLGSIFAQQVARAFSGYFNIRESATGTQVTYPLQQTACPAIVLEMPDIETTEEELRLGEPWYLRLQAYALFVGILEHFTVPDHGVLTVQIGDGGANWTATLDDTWHLLTSSAGTVTFKAVERGPHTLSLRKHGTVIDREVEFDTGEHKTITISTRE